VTLYGDRSLATGSRRGQKSTLTCWDVKYDDPPKKYKTARCATDFGSYGPTRPGPVHPCLSENSPRHSVTVQCRSGRADWYQRIDASQTFGAMTSSHRMIGHAHERVFITGTHREYKSEEQMVTRQDSRTANSEQRLDSVNK